MNLYKGLNYISCIWNQMELSKNGIWKRWLWLTQDINWYIHTFISGKWTCNSRFYNFIVITYWVILKLVFNVGYFKHTFKS